MSEPSSEADEADRLDQEAPVYGAEVADLEPGLSAFDADEADLADQRREATIDDEAYPVDG